jgi:hypothetical protein
MLFRPAKSQLNHFLEASRRTPMAGEKTYVHIEKFGVTKIFDDKYKSKVQEAMRKTAEKLVDKSSLLTTDEKATKKKEGLYLDGNLSKFEKNEKDGKTLLNAEISMQMATWPKKSMFGFPSGSIKVAMDGTGALNEREVESVVKDLVEDIFTKQKVVKEFEKRAK